MRLLKHFIEKPSNVWFLILIINLGLFISIYSKNLPNDSETAIQSIVQDFAQSSFPPKIHLIKELPDWGHVGYYALMGLVAKAVKGKDESQLFRLRLVNLLIAMAALFLFVQLGWHYTSHNRLHPIWISLGLILMAINPYTWNLTMRLSYFGMLILLTLISLYYFEKEDFKNSSFALALAALVDLRALILSVAFIIVRLTQSESKLLRPERAVALLFPIFVACLPFFPWQGVVPFGEVRDFWHLVREKTTLFHLDGLFYSLALIPVYVLYYSWNWGVRARLKSMKYGVIVALLFSPFFFLFPIHFDKWSEIKFGMEVPLGLLDQVAVNLAGKYKNLLLFVPWFAGVFLFVQLIMRDVLDKSKLLRLIIILYFVVQPFLFGMGGSTTGGPGSTGDTGFIFIIPFMLLFTLSEALVGDEGKLN